MKTIYLEREMVLFAQNDRDMQGAFRSTVHLAHRNRNAAESTNYNCVLS